MSGAAPIVADGPIRQAGDFVGRMTSDVAYTYLHLRADDLAPFYVGKGRMNRAWRHNGRSTHWKRVVAKHGLTVKIVSIFESDALAFAHEVRLIAEARAAGIKLVNATDGGDGVVGHVRSRETSAKIVAAAAAWRRSEAGRSWSIKQSEAAVAMMSNPSHAAKIAAARDAHFSKKENREAVGERMRSYYADPENNLAVRRRIAERMAMPGTLVQMSRAAGGRPFMHVETGVIYETQGEAARALGIAQSSISQVLSGRNLTAGGHTFKHIDGGAS